MLLSNPSHSIPSHIRSQQIGPSSTFFLLFFLDILYRYCCCSPGPTSTARNLDAVASRSHPEPTTTHLLHLPKTPIPACMSHVCLHDSRYLFCPVFFSRFGPTAVVWNHSTERHTEPDTSHKLLAPRASSQSTRYLSSTARPQESSLLFQPPTTRAAATGPEKLARCNDSVGQLNNLTYRRQFPSHQTHHAHVNADAGQDIPPACCQICTSTTHRMDSHRKFSHLPKN